MISVFEKQQVRSSAVEYFITQFRNSDANISSLPGSRQNVSAEEYVQYIVDVCNVRKEVDKYAYVAAFDEIKEVGV